MGASLPRLPEEDHWLLPKLISKPGYKPLHRPANLLDSRGSERIEAATLRERLAQTLRSGFQFSSRSTRSRIAGIEAASAGERPVCTLAQGTEMPNSVMGAFTVMRSNWIACTAEMQ